MKNIETSLPGFDPKNVIRGAFVVPMKGGIAVIHQDEDGGYYAEFYEGSGNSSGCYFKTITGATRAVKRYSREYQGKIDRRETIQKLMRQLAKYLN